MSQIGTAMVGNEFVLPPRLPASAPRVKITPVRDGDSVPVIPVEAISQLDIIPVTVTSSATSHFGQLLESVHRHSFMVFVTLFLLVAASGIEVGGGYLSARIVTQTQPASSTLKKHTIAGLNLTVPASGLQSKLQSITGQPATLTVGTQAIPISSDIIQSWLKITPNTSKSQDYIHINSALMAKSLGDMANGFVATPVNQVTVTHDGISQVILAGRNGAQLTDPGSLSTQSDSLAKSVMDGKGLNFSTPLISQPFQAITPAAFNKLIEVNVDAHQMYLYDNGNLTRSYAVSAGSPTTPTPIGQFRIWEKLAMQTMTGFNPNGTKYAQPNVPWINYFDHSGDAVHGNYWRPATVFGTVNTSHGCVSLPVDQAKWVYDWAPVGTTVITYH